MSTIPVFFSWREKVAATPVRHRSRPTKPVGARSKPWHRNKFLESAGVGAVGTLGAIGGIMGFSHIAGKGPSYSTDEGKAHAQEFLNQPAAEQTSAIEHEFGGS